MISSSPNEDSEAALMSSIYKFSNAGASVIQVRTREVMRAAYILRKHLIGSESPYKEWDVVNGFRDFTNENLVDNKVTGTREDFLQAILYPLEQLRLPTSIVNAQVEQIHYFVYVDAQPYIANNPIAIEVIQQYASILPSTNVCILFVTPLMALTDIPSGTLLVTDLPTPTADELQKVLSRIIKESGDTAKNIKLKAGDLEKVANMGLGLSLYEFETHAAITIVESGMQGEKSISVDHFLEGIAKGKTEVIKQSEILELMATESMEDVGGMGRLKKWVAARAGCYSDEAKAFGIETPRGVVLAGLSGTGKSTVAKCIASELGVPLIKMDFSRVFSKFVGDSEARIHAALKMIEGMSPLVVLIDELDKVLGGSGGGGDSGTSSRVLGTFLTWLQENNTPVFTVVTLNKVDGLPPELLRRGRFDQIFSVSLPNPEERKDILAIHLRKRGRKMVDFSASDVAHFLEKSEGYVPAEIESAVKDALIAAFNDTNAEDVEMRHILNALSFMVPMSKAHPEVTERLARWAENFAIPVAEMPKAAVTAGAGTRVIRTRKATND